MKTTNIILKIKRKIKRKINKIFVLFNIKYGYLKTNVKLNFEWHGNNYGGFYVCSKFLNKDSIIYSIGIGEDITFDQSVIENFNCKVFGFDPTPKSIDWIKRQNTPIQFNFYDFGISNKNEIVEFYLPKNKESDISGSIILHNDLSLTDKVIVQMRTVDYIMKEFGHKHIDVLKMDIEGAEYKVIDNIITSKISVTQILVEFHGYFTEHGQSKTKTAIKKRKRPSPANLLIYYYYYYYICPYNICPYVFFLLLGRDYKL